MKNRQRLLESFPYDMLMHIQETLQEHGLCVLDCIDGYDSDRIKRCLFTECDACIQKWLNAEDK